MIDPVDHSTPFIVAGVGLLGYSPRLAATFCSIGVAIKFTQNAINGQSSELVDQMNEFHVRYPKVLTILSIFTLVFSQISVIIGCLTASCLGVLIALVFETRGNKIVKIERLRKQFIGDC